MTPPKEAWELYEKKVRSTMISVLTFLIWY